MRAATRPRYYPALVRKGFVDQHGRPMASLFGVGGSGGYEAGSRARRNRHWQPRASGPNAAYYDSLETMRARARHAVRNNGYATSAVQVFTSNSVGTGIVPRWRLDDEELAQKITTEWERWVDRADADGNLDFYGLQALTASTMFTSGEALVRMRPRTASDGLNVPMQLQVLEPDYLDSSVHRDEGNRHYRLGIEFDRIGRRRAYWMYGTHPGDGLSLPGALVSHPVPARDVIHVYRVDRPGQVRGVPWLAPVLARLRQLEEYEDAELVRKKIAALFAAFVRKAPGGDLPELGLVGHEEADEQGAEVTLEPGTVSYLNPGEDVQFAEPADVGGSYETFMRVQLRAVASGMGLTYEQLTSDLTGVNYSSIRSGVLEFRRRIEAFQHLVLVHQLCRKVMLRWLDLAVAWGTLDLPGYWDDPTPYQHVEWQPQGWDWVDPGRDLHAALEGIKAGITSREAEAAKRGHHVEDIDRANARDAARARELGLKYTTDVGADREGGSSSVQSGRQVEDDEQDDNESEDERR